MNGLPVVVVGAGPVGLAAAAQLRERGVPVVVFERGPVAGHARGRERGCRDGGPRSTTAGNLPPGRDRSRSTARRGTLLRRPRADAVPRPPPDCVHSRPSSSEQTDPHTGWSARAVPRMLDTEDDT